MEFEGQYLTYEEYKALGGALDLTPFNLLEFEARRKIDLRTDNRLVNLESKDIPSEVKLCEYKMIDSVLKAYDEQVNRGKSSESVGSYSVTYNSDMKEIIKSKNAELNDLILSELYGVIVNDEHILYCGVR
jgi:hypothetical protein